MTTIFDGKEFARKKEEMLANKAAALIGVGITPTLATILVGEDAASSMYVGLKQKAAERVGIEFKLYKVPGLSPQTELVQLIEFLNNDPEIDGILIQLPLPREFNLIKESLINMVNIEKDVDGLREESKFIPATVSAILHIFKEAKVTPRDSIAVWGSNGEVGKRLVKQLKRQEFNVVEIDIDTANAAELSSMSKVVVSATGKKGVIGTDSVREGAIVIDVGAPFPEVKFDEVHKKVDFITPVPGGVGPVTVISLMENLIEAASSRR